MNVPAKISKTRSRLNSSRWLLFALPAYLLLAYAADVDTEREFLAECLRRTTMLTAEVSSHRTLHSPHCQIRRSVDDRDPQNDTPDARG